MAFGRAQPHVRALVLCAGYGTRLRPLTALFPKPLLPVLGESLVARTLGQLEHAGCERAWVNLHHLPDTIRDAVGERHGEMEVRYSFEEEILGTCGALGPVARDLAGAEAAVLVNGDSLCPWPVRQLVQRHLARGAKATLLVCKRPPFPGNVAVGKDQRLLQLRTQRELQESEVAARDLVFAGAQVLSPEILDQVAGDSEPADIVEKIYEPLLDAGEPVHVVLTSKPWFDLGTPWRVLEAVAATTRRRHPVKGWWAADDASVAPTAKVRHAALEAGAHVEDRARVERSLVLAGARVGAGCVVRESILAPGVEIPPGSGIERRVVTPLSAGRDPEGRDSVVGQLVYTPIQVPTP